MESKQQDKVIKQFIPKFHEIFTWMKKNLFGKKSDHFEKGTNNYWLILNDLDFWTEIVLKTSSIEQMCLFYYLLQDRSKSIEVL